MNWIKPSEFHSYQLLAARWQHDWFFPTIVIVGSIAVEAVSIQVMSILSRMYQSVSSGDEGAFHKTLLFAVFIICLLAVLKAGVAFASDMCAITWRTCIVEQAHHIVFSKQGVDTVVVHDSIDQRVTQDVDRLTANGAKLLADTAALPAVIAFYSAYLVVTFGWQVVLACVGYFALGSAVSYCLARRLVSVVYAQESLEGEFRSTHVGYQLHRSEIHLLRGERAENLAASDAFNSLYANTLLLLRRKLPLNMFSTWFAYMGSVANYVVVGGAIMQWSADASEAERAAKLAEGSYACLYLINALSTLIASAKTVGELAGLAQRVEELLRAGCDATSSAVEDTCSSPVRHCCDWRKDGARPASDRGSSVAGYSLVPGQEVELGLAVANNKAHPPQATPFLTTALLQIMDLDVEADADASAALPYPPHSSATSSRVLVRGLSLTVPPGMRLLVTGPSGSGKSTLVRRISEAVRAEEDVEYIGHLTNPRRDAVNNASVVLGIPLSQLTICPQRPYLFKGTLRANLLYPAMPKAGRTESETVRLREVLQGVGLGRLCELYFPSSGKEIERDLAAVLSAGEMQRVAVARLLLTTPALAVFDEVTSALDEEAEQALYAAICAQCRTFISIGHRSTIRPFHTHELRLHGDGSYAFAPLPTSG